MGRGRGKGKRGGRGGGGRQHFVSSLEELESRNDRDEAWAARRKADRDDDESGEDGEEKKEVSNEEEGSEEVSTEEDDDVGAPPGGMVEVEKKVKIKGVSALIEVENPNAKAKAGKMMKAKVSRRCLLSFAAGLVSLPLHL